MDGIEQKLEAILSDPASMGRVMELAKSLGLDPPQAASQPAAESQSSTPSPMPALPLGSLGTLLSSMSDQGGDDKQTHLLKALRPYLRPERQDRLDRAIQAARMVKIAKQALRQFSP